MLFVVTYTAYSDSDSKELWTALTDINNWPAWDVRIKSTRAEASAKAGTTYTMRPVGGNEKTIRVLKASDGVFHDASKLEFGSVETERTVVANKGGGSIVTQTMRADIEPESAKAFQESFWGHWSQGIIDSTKALAHEPSRREMLAKHKNVA